MDHCSFGFVFPTALKDILWVHPFWYTRKANAKATVIARIVIGINFLHSFGFIHSYQKLGNAFPVNIIEFKLQTLNEVDLTRVTMPRLCGVGSEFAVFEMQSSEERTPKIDIFSFVLILFEIIVDLPVFRWTSPSEKFRKLPVSVDEHG
jgi:hypothetical protein